MAGKTQEERAAHLSKEDYIALFGEKAWKAREASLKKLNEAKKPNTVCPKCRYTWKCTTKRQFATCPSCGAHVNLNLNRFEV